MKTVTLNMIVIKPLQGSFNRNNKYLERMLLLKSVYGRGLKHAAREDILCGPRCIFGILK